MSKSSFFKIRTQTFTNSMFLFRHRHDYELTFNISMPPLNKADRLLFGESLMTHAMAISGVAFDVSNYDGSSYLVFILLFL